MNRRQILSVFAAGAAGSLVGAARWPAVAGDLAPGAVAARLATLYSARESAAAIGREYLIQAPLEADPERLVALLWPTLPQSELAGLPLARLHALAASRHAGDFAGGRIVSLRGWLLSRSEARLCALVALAG